jgi:inositol polyphosphate 5-phosphatase INPP5B/F
VPGGSRPLETQSTNTQESSSTSSTLIAGDDDPDMLVLGFQELDLSTEALLYSTGTMREDAWCLAVFAGLGEKADLYEKVKYSRRFDFHSSSHFDHMCF